MTAPKKWLPDTPWLPVTAPLTSGTAKRDPALTEGIVAQFAVEVSPRYQPRDDDGNGVRETFCNIFAMDVTTALGCGLPRVWPVASQWRELNANALVEWLASAAGRERGWQPATDVEAQQAVDEGRVAVACWHSRGAGPGHIAVVVPSQGQPGTWIAQAGGRNSSRCKLAAGFGSKTVSFFVHP